MAGGGQPVDKTGDKRRFRTDNDQVGADVVGQRQQPVKVLGADIDAAAERFHGGASRRDDQLFGQRRAGNRPGQRVFAAAAADQKYFHLLILLVDGGQDGLPTAQYGIRLDR